MKKKFEETELYSHLVIFFALMNACMVVAGLLGIFMLSMAPIPEAQL